LGELKELPEWWAAPPSGRGFLSIRLGTPLTAHEYGQSATLQKLERGGTNFSYAT